MTFPTTCGSCSSSCETRMFVTNIPYFQEVIVMASTCDACGYRNSELKPGGRIPEKGKAITLCVKNANDLSRDVIKSDTAGVKVQSLTWSWVVGLWVRKLLKVSSQKLVKVLREFMDLLLEIALKSPKKASGKALK
uniref:Zinc finger ZPR1-type domain-containing protein n=1 Tax=Salix viminalis TaxID=40686 RepID=A0A6N2MCE4_SALVM